MSRILDNWKKGQCFPETLVIDGHIHIGDWPHAATFANVDEAVRESRAYLDANGVDAFCAVSGGYNIGPGADYRLGNDFLLAVWKKLKDRMVPFLSVNPNDTKENILAELERMYAAGVRCIKLINDYQEHYPGDGPTMMALYEYADAHRMLVFNHGWAPEVIRKIAKKFPRTDFIFAHYGGGWQDDVLRERKNVYTNIWSLGPMGWLERGIKKVGAHKFMYGSDGFLNSLSVGLGPVVFADISDDDKKKVLGLNVARLLNKVGALPATL
jgi:predicted TIM-barrel fold metal-dependent hydrolase